MSQCVAFVVWDSSGRLRDPRGCSRPARSGSNYCTIHGRLARRPVVTVSNGGFCIVCAGPARAYSFQGENTRLAFCDQHARALAPALHAWSSRKEASQP